MLEAAEAPVALYYIVSSCAFASSASSPEQGNLFRTFAVEKLEKTKVTDYFLS